MGPGGGAPGGVITLPGGGGDASNASMANSNANTSGANDSSAADKSGASGTVASGGGGEDSSKFPKILLMGLRRSGKSSIQKVVFHKMSPNETLFLESTAQIVKDEVSNSSFVQFAVWDFPGQVDFFDPAFDAEKVFERCGAVVYVVDAQDDYTEAMQRLTQTVQKAFEAKPDIRFEVFIHKVRFFAFANCKKESTIPLILVSFLIFLNFKFKTLLGGSVLLFWGRKMLCFVVQLANINQFQI